MSISASTPFGYDLSQILSTDSSPEACPALVSTVLGPCWWFRVFSAIPRARSIAPRIASPEAGSFKSTAAGRQGQRRDGACRCLRDAGTRSVVQRTAAEGRKAGAEDRARVDQVGVGDDTFRQRALRL